MTGLEIAAIIGQSGSLASGLSNAITSGFLGHKNLQFAKDQFNYQKQLNAQYMDRLDNKLQYLKKDAEKAGVNILSALGQSGGYSPLSAGTAPKQDAPLMSDLTYALGNVSQVSKIMSDIKTAQSVQNLNTASAEAQKAQAEANRALALKHKQDLEYAQAHNIPTGLMPALTPAIIKHSENIINEGKDKFKSWQADLGKFNDFVADINAKIDENDGYTWADRLDDWLFRKLEEFDRNVVDKYRKKPIYK